MGHLRVRCRFHLRGCVVSAFVALWGCVEAGVPLGEPVFVCGPCAGVPRLNVNGEYCAGTAVLPCPFEKSDGAQDSLRTFATIGIRFSSDVWTMPGGQNREQRQWWLGDGVYDWPAFDARVETLLSASPNGFVFPRIKIDPPKAWLESHPEAKLWSAVRPDLPEWRSMYRRMLRDMVAHVDAQPWANRIGGYHIAALRCGEWLDYPADFHSGLPSADVAACGPLPPLSSMRSRRLRVRELTSAFADAALDAATCVKELTRGRKLVGLFFGYSWFAHEEMARVFRSGSVDFIAAPPHYGRFRDCGGAGRSQVFYQASLRLHGKVFYEESDFRTFLSNPAFAPAGMVRMRPLPESIGVIRRSIGKCLAGGWENWWFLIGGNETYSDPLILDTIRIGCAEERNTLKTNAWRPAQVAVFTAPNEFATSQGAPSQELRNRNLVRFHADTLPSCGVPFDSYLLDDIAEPTLPDYTVYIFPNAFTLPESLREKIMEKVRRSGRTAVWMTAPGYCRGDSGNASNVADLSGIPVDDLGFVTCIAKGQPVGRGECAELCKDGWRSVCLANAPTASGLREILRRAGVHVWSETDDPIAVGRGFVMLHSSADGQKRLALPAAADVSEIFGEEAPRLNVSELVFELRRGQTRVFKMSGGGAR